MATTEIVFAVRVTDVAAPIDRDRALNASSLQGDNLTAAAAAFSVSTADRELSAVRSDLVAAIDTLAQAHEAEQLSLTQAAVTTATQPLHARIAQLTAELTACNEKFESHVAQLAQDHHRADFSPAAARQGARHYGDRPGTPARARPCRRYDPGLRRPARARRQRLRPPTLCGVSVAL